MLTSSVFCSHFVPNLTIGAPVIESLRKHTKAYLDCHLMVANPLDYVEPFGKAGASGFTFHVEVSKDNWQELVHQIKAKCMRPGVALKPGTPVEEVYPLLQGEHRVEMVLVMTVEPGFGGQKFMPEMMNKVRTLREKFPTLDIEVSCSKPYFRVRYIGFVWFAFSNLAAFVRWFHGVYKVNENLHKW